MTKVCAIFSHWSSLLCVPAPGESLGGGAVSASSPAKAGIFWGLRNERSRQPDVAITLLPWRKVLEGQPYLKGRPFPDLALDRDGPAEDFQQPLDDM